MFIVIFTLSISIYNIEGNTVNACPCFQFEHLDLDGLKYIFKVTSDTNWID